MPSAEPPGTEGIEQQMSGFSEAQSNSDRLVWLINTEHSRLQRQLRVQLTFLFSVRVCGKAASTAGTERPSSPAACPTWCVCTSTSCLRSRCFLCCSTRKVGWGFKLFWSEECHLLSVLVFSMSSLCHYTSE